MPQTFKRRIIVGFGHHAETNKWLKQMKRADTVLLEAPPEPYLEKVLSKKISMKNYFTALRFGADLSPVFPEHTARLIRGLRASHAKGKKILQSEPERKGFLKMLSDELPSAQQKARAAWPFGGFDEGIKAVTEKAKLNAEINNMREKERVNWILQNVNTFGKRVFIETGQNHTKVYHELKRKLEGTHNNVTQIQLNKREAQRYGRGVGFIYPPENQLERLFIFSKNPDHSKIKLLAARALISDWLNLQHYRKRKLESRSVKTVFKIARFTNKLSLEQCEKAFNLIREDRTGKLVFSLEKLKKLIQT